MPNRSSTGLLLPVIIVVGLVAVFGGSKVITAIEGIFTNHDPVTIGETGNQLLVGSDGEDQAKQCTTSQMLTDRRCGKLKIVVMDAFITRNIQLAWTDGKPAMLTRNSAKQAANRAAACGRFTPKYGGSCDEYAFATTDQGGADSRTEEVPLREQRCQGGAVNGGYTKANIAQGEDFLVVISNPDKIAAQPFMGSDIAEDQAQCLS